MPSFYPPVRFMASQDKEERHEYPPFPLLARKQLPLGISLANPSQLLTNSQMPSDCVFGLITSWLKIPLAPWQQHPT